MAIRAQEQRFLSGAEVPETTLHRQYLPEQCKRRAECSNNDVPKKNNFQIIHEFCTQSGEFSQPACWVGRTIERECPLPATAASTITGDHELAIMAGLELHVEPNVDAEPCIDFNPCIDFKPSMISSSFPVDPRYVTSLQAQEWTVLPQSP